MVTDLSWTVKYTEYNALVKCEDSRKHRINVFLIKEQCFEIV